MDIYNIEGTANTPKIVLDHRNHTLDFSGESRPDNVREFFEPVYKWLNDYKNYLFFLCKEYGKQVTTTVNFNMEYFNSSTVRVFNEVLTELKKVSTENKDVSLVVNWYYQADDIDNKEAGEEFADLVKIDINIISV